MTCRRASEVDLAAMLRGEDGPEQREFRDHYPRCRDCAAEVDAWTAVHGLLTAAADVHPTPKKLLWYVDRPQSLATADRDRIAAHVADCRSCRDEMATLKGLDLHALTRPLAAIAAAPAGPAPRRSPEPAETPPWWHTLGWPRLALLVVAMGLVPLLTSRLAPPPVVPEAAKVAVGEAPAQAPPSTPSAGETDAARGRTTASGDGAVRENRAGGSSTAKPAPAGKAPPPAAVANDQPDNPNPGTRGFEAETAPAPGEPTLLARRHEPSAAVAPKASQPLGARAAGADADRSDGAAPPLADAAPPAAPPVVHLRRAGTVRVKADEHAPFTIVTPAHPAAGGTDAEVHVVDAGARRELRQQGTLADGAVSTTVPGAWLTPGEYQVEVRVGGVLTIYRLAVDR